MSDATEQTIPMPLFMTGRVVITPDAQRLLADEGVSAIDFIARHVYGDWSEMDIPDQLQNVMAVRDSFRVFSSYRAGPRLDAPRVLVITAADRSSTCVLRPADA